MKRRIIIILVIVGILGGATAGTWWYLRRNAGQKMLARAELALRAEKFEKALGLAKGYIAKYPKDWRGYYVKARVLIRLGRHADARKALTEAGRLNPTEVSVPITKAESYSMPARRSLADRDAVNQPAVLTKAIEQFHQANEILLKAKTSDPKRALDVRQHIGLNYQRIALAWRRAGERLAEEVGVAEASRNVGLAAAKRRESDEAFSKSNTAADQAIKTLLDVIRKDVSRPIAARVLVELCIHRKDEKSLDDVRAAFNNLKEQKPPKSPPPVAAMRLAIHDLASETDPAARREQLGRLTHLLDNLLKEHPDELEVKLTRADVAVKLGDLATAERLCNEVLKTNPRQYLARLIQARVLMKRGNYTEAERVLFALKTDYPKWSDAHFAYAQAALETGKRELAREAMRTVTKLDPDHALARRYLAQSLLEDGFHDQAFTDAQEYYRAHRDDPVALWLFVKTAKRTDHTELAKEALEKADTDDLSDPEMLMVIADGYKLLADHAKSQQALRKAAECKSNTAAGLFAIARAMVQVGRAPEAEKILTDELARDPKQSRVCFELGRFYLTVGRVMQAIKQFRAAIQIDSRNAAYRLALARAMFSIGDLEQCLNVLEQADQSSTEANLLRLEVELLLGKSVSTEKMLKSIRYVKKAGLPLAMIYLNSGRLEQCVEVCLAELKKTPYDNRLRFVLGQAYLAQGQKNKCLKEWSTVLEARPDRLPTYLRITRVLAEKDTPKQVEKTLVLIPNARKDMIDLAMGWLFVRLRNFNAAVGAYTRLMDRAEASAFTRNRARLLRAKALAAGGKHERAVAELDGLSKNEAWYDWAMAEKVTVLVGA